MNSRRIEASLEELLDLLLDLGGLLPRTRHDGGYCQGSQVFVTVQCPGVFQLRAGRGRCVGREKVRCVATSLGQARRKQWSKPRGEPQDLARDVESSTRFAFTPV